MRACWLAWIVALVAFAAPHAGHAQGLESAGNTDGVLTWTLGDLPPGGSARQVVLLTYGAWPEELQARLAAARDQYAAELPAAPAPDAGEPPSKVWIANESTDFALEGPCFFRWRLERQALACARGGQLSQFTWYVHYTDAVGSHRAGTPQDGDSTPEDLVIEQAPRALSGTEAAGAVRTADGKLRVAVRALVGPGTAVAIEFRATNLAQDALSDLTLTTYANLESAHDEANDLSVLDATTDGLLVLDPGTNTACCMAGLSPPARGYSGTWNSFAWLQKAEGIDRAQWQPFAGPSPEMMLRAQQQMLEAQGIYLPYPIDQASTPETRDLTPDEATAALERDWLFQAMGEPLAERARKEIGWARALAARLAEDPKCPSLTAPLRQLDKTERRLLDLSGRGIDDASVRELYLQVRRAKRSIALSNPVIDFGELLFIDQPYPRGPVNDIHEAIHRMGITASPGGRLLVLSGLDPGGHVRQLAPAEAGSFWRPDLSFDAKRVLFCYKAWNGKSFHLYEVGLDGSGLRQLTDSEYDDIDPMYLPDGHIMFTTTRGNSYVRCGPFIYSYVLARCDADGGNVYLVSYNGEPDFVPSLMDDGRVVYSRWEYTDKALWRVQSLWTTEQDGTNTAVLWGNQSVWPDHLAQPRQIPGSRRIMFVGVGHHDWWSGSVGIVDPSRGLNFPDGLTKVTADRPWPECSQPPLDAPESPEYHASGAFTGYQSPYPLSERDLLVSARGEGGKFRLYLMDIDGNRELIYEGASNVIHAIPVRPRPAPAAQPDRVIWPGTGDRRQPSQLGRLFSSDVYQGVPDLPRGSARFLRVVQQDHKTYSTWAKTYRHSGPPVSIVQEESVKRILSEVPVEADGSVHFDVPPGRQVYFQLLDASRRCLQTMRSFTGVLPGETRGCVGCHESHTTAPPQQLGMAVRRPASPLSPPPWGPVSISYERFAQPVLDRHCGSCHQGEGAAKQTLDLTLRPGSSVFVEPYLTLVGAAGWGTPVGPGAPGYGIAAAIPVETMDPTMNSPVALRTLRPMQYLSYTSRLVELAASGAHYDVRVGGEDLRRLMAWVDMSAPFMGEEELRALGDPDFPGIETLPIRPRVATAPVIERP